MEVMRNNRYELLSDDDDGTTGNTDVSNIPKKPVAESTKSSTNLKIEKENKSGNVNKSLAVKKKNDQLKSKSNIESKKQAVFDNKNQPNQNHSVENGGLNNGRPKMHDRENNRGGFRNRENAVFRGGKREFDRQSGSDKTGVKAVDKREGAGAHNWGSVKQEIDNINQNDNVDGENVSLDKDDCSNDQTIEAAVVPEDDDAKKITFEEWKAMQQQREKPKYNIRKPGEGEGSVNNEWKKMVLLNKKNDDDEEELEFEFDPSLYPQRVGRLQRIVDIQFNFNDNRRVGFNRPRRGGKFVNDNVNDKRGHGKYNDLGRYNARRNFSTTEGKQDEDSSPLDYEKQFPTLS